MDYASIFQHIWVNCTLKNVRMKPHKLFSFLLKRIKLLAKEMGHAERKSELQAFFLEDSLQWVENDLPNTMAPFYILTETGAILPGNDGTKDCIKKYYLERAEYIGYYVQLLNQLKINSKKVKDNKELLLQIVAMVTLVSEVYLIDIEMLNNYLMQLSEFLQGKTKKVEKVNYVVSLADFVYEEFSSCPEFDFNYSLIENESKREK